MSDQPSVAARNRIARWMSQAKPVTSGSTWTERRRIIEIGEDKFLLEEGQVFQCPHCGSYDPEWSTTEVVNHFKTIFDKVKVYDIEINVNWNGDQQ